MVIEKTTVRVSVALSQRLANLGTINDSMENVIETILRLSNAEIDIKKFHKALLETRALGKMKGKTEIECPECHTKFIDNVEGDIISCPECGHEIILSELNNNTA